jgi:outer membrane protein OmpA-like peptidoglycan-associated protein
VQVTQSDPENVHPSTLGMERAPIKKVIAPMRCILCTFTRIAWSATMPRHHLLLSIVAFMASSAPAWARTSSASAGSDGLSLGLGVFGGGHYFAEGTNLGVAAGGDGSAGASSNAAGGIRASVGFGRWFMAEAEILGLETRDRTYQRGARLFGYRVNALAAMMPGDFRPFVLVGAGAMQVASTDAVGPAGLVRDTDGEVHVGLGFDYRVVDRLSVRGDARVLEMPSKENWGLTTDVEATLGAVVTLGEGAKSRAPVMGSSSPEDVVSRPAPVEVRAPAPTPTPARIASTMPAHAPTAPEIDEANAARAPAPVDESDVEPAPVVTPTVSDLLGRAGEIKFDMGSTKLAESSLPYLDQLAAALMKEPGARIEIISHTADNGDAKKDLALSKRRAESIKALLVGKGVIDEQLVAIGRGSTEPIAPNLTRTGKMRNERVEIHRAPPFK